MDPLRHNAFLCRKGGRAIRRLNKRLSAQIHQFGRPPRLRLRRRLKSDLFQGAPAMSQPKPTNCSPRGDVSLVAPLGPHPSWAKDAKAGASLINAL